MEESGMLATLLKPLAEGKLSLDWGCLDRLNEAREGSLAISRLSLVLERTTAAAPNELLAWSRQQKLSGSEQKELCAKSQAARLVLEALEKERAITPLEARRLVARAGRQWLGDGVRIARATFDRKKGSVEDDLELLVAESKTTAATERSELRVTGGELISEGLLKKGPEVGQALDYLVEQTLEQPEANEPKRLRSLASEWARHRST